MSFIHFLGKPILPPVLKERVQKADKNRKKEKKEDEWLLSLSQAAAVDVLLNDPTYPCQVRKKPKSGPAHNKQRYELPSISSSIESADLNYSNATWHLGKLTTPLHPSPSVNLEKKSRFGITDRCRSGLMLSPHQSPVSQHYADASPYQVQYTQKHQVQEEQPKHLLQQKQKEQLRLQQLQEQRLRARGYSNSFQLAMSRSCGEAELPLSRRRSLPRSSLLNYSTTTLVSSSSSSSDSGQPAMDPCEDKIPVVPPPVMPSQDVLDDYLLQLTGQALPPPTSKPQCMSQSWSPCVQTQSHLPDARLQESPFSCSQSIKSEKTKCNSKTTSTEETELDSLSVSESLVSKMKAPSCVGEAERSESLLDSPSGEELPKWLKEAKTRKQKGDVNGRSVGSNYLDSYLGNLTQHSWLNYAPSTPVQPAAYSPKRVFIYPEVFYKKDPTPGEPLFMSRSFTEGVTSAESLKYRDGLKRSHARKASSPSTVMEGVDVMSGEERISSDSPVDTAGRTSAIGTIDDVSITRSVGTESGMGTDIGAKALSSLSRTSSSRFSDIANVITEAEHSFAVDSLETDVPCGTETSGVITHGTQSNGSEVPPIAIDEEEVTISESFPDIPFENENHEDSSAVKALVDNTRSHSSSDSEKTYAKNQTDNSGSQSGSDTEKENVKPGLNFLVGGRVSSRDDQSCTSNASDESSCCTQPSTIVMIRDETENCLNSAQTGNKGSIQNSEILTKSSPVSLTCQETDRNVNEKSFSSLQDNLVNNNNILNSMNNIKSETSSQSKELIQDSLNSSFDSLSSLKKLSLDSNSNTTVAKPDKDKNIDEMDENGSEETVISQGKIVSFDLPHCTSAASTPDMSLVSAASVCGTSASLAEDSEMTASDICRDDPEESFEDHEQDSEINSGEKQGDLTGTQDAAYPEVTNKGLKHERLADDSYGERTPEGSDNFQQRTAEGKNVDAFKGNLSEEGNNSTNEPSWINFDRSNVPARKSEVSEEASKFSDLNVQENRNVGHSMVTNQEKISVTSANQDFTSSPSHMMLSNRSVVTAHQRPVAVTAPLAVVSSTAEKRWSIEGVASPVTSCRSLSSITAPGNEHVQATSPARTQYCPITSGNYTNTSAGSPLTGNGSKPNTPSSPARASFNATTPTAAGTCFYQQQSSRVTTPMSSPHRHSTPTTPSGSFYSPVAPGGSSVLGKCSSRQHQINALLQLLRVQHHHEREQLIAKQQEEMQQFMQHLQKLTPAQLQHIVSSQVSSVQSARGAARSSELEMSKSPSTGESAPTASQGSPPNHDSSSPCEDSYASSSVTASQSTPSLSEGAKNAANKSPTSFYLHNPANPVAATTPGHLNKLFLQFPSKKMPSPPQKAMSPLCSKPMVTRPQVPHVSRTMSEGAENTMDIPTTVIVSDHDPNGLMSTSQSKHVKQVINEKQAAHCKRSSPAVIKEKMLNAPSAASATSQLAPITPHEDMAELSASLTNSDIFNSLQSSLISEGGGNANSTSLPRSATVTKLTTETFLPSQRSENKDATTARPVLPNKRRSNSAVVQGVTKLQAAVRGRHVRRLLRCSAVQQHILTLAEVSKLAAQFHRDILADNVNKGDIDFHRALYQQEQVARSELRRIFVSCSFMEQVRLIRRDRRRSDAKVPRLPRPRASVPGRGGGAPQHRPASAGRGACSGAANLPHARSRSQPSPRQLPLPKKYHQQVPPEHSMENAPSVSQSYPHGSNSAHSYGGGCNGGGGVAHGGGVGHGGTGGATHAGNSKSVTKSGGRTSGGSQYRYVQSRYLGSVSKNSSQKNNTSRNSRPSSGVPRRVALPNCAASASFSSGAVAPTAKPPHHNEKICQQRAAALAASSGGGAGYGRMNGSGGGRRPVVPNGSAAPGNGGGATYDRRGSRKLWR